MELVGLAAIKKHAGMGFERLLYVQDRWGTSAIDELRTRNESMMHYINKVIYLPPVYIAFSVLFSFSSLWYLLI